MQKQINLKTLLVIYLEKVPFSFRHKEYTVSVHVHV